MILLRKMIVVIGLFTGLLHAGFQARVLNLNSRTMAADDEMIGSESINLICKECLTGRGYIQAPSITIKVKKFAFTGTIHCDGTCHITAQEPFDETMFTRKGTGSFAITIDPNLQFDQLQDPAMPTVTVPSVPKYSFVPAADLARKEIIIKDSKFVVEGAWHIAMAEAIQKDDRAEVVSLLEKNSGAKDDRKLITLCMVMAGLSGHMALVEKFIELGADVNGRDCGVFGQYHLITAVIAKQADFVAALIKAGANPNVATQDWMPVLVIATILQDIESVQALLQSPKIEINATDRESNTALMHAAAKGNGQLVTMLLAAGADSAKKNFKWHSALDYAVVGKHTHVARLLKEKSEPKKERSINSQKPFYKDVTLLPAAAMIGVVAVTYGAPYAYALCKKLIN